MKTFVHRLFAIIIVSVAFDIAVRAHKVLAVVLRLESIVRRRDVC